MAALGCRSRRRSLVPRVVAVGGTQTPGQPTRARSSSRPGYDRLERCLGVRLCRGRTKPTVSGRSAQYLGPAGADPFHDDQVETRLNVDRSRPSVFVPSRVAGSSRLCPFATASMPSTEEIAPVEEGMMPGDIVGVNQRGGWHGHEASLRGWTSRYRRGHPRPKSEVGHEGFGQRREPDGRGH